MRAFLLCLLLPLAAGSGQEENLHNSDLYRSPAEKETPGKGEFIVYHQSEGEPAGEGKYFKEHEPGEIAEFHLFVPADPDPQRKIPLMIVFHGGKDGGSGKGLCRSMARLSTKERPVLVLSPNMYTMDAYNEILAEKKYPIDTDRVVVLGFSSGGYGVRSALMEFAKTSGSFTPAMLISASTAAVSPTDEYPEIPYVVIAGEQETAEFMKHPALKNRRSTCRKHLLDMQEKYREARYIEMKGIGHSITRPQHLAVLLNLLRGLPEPSFRFSARKARPQFEVLLKHANSEDWTAMRKELARLDGAEKLKHRNEYRRLRRNLLKALTKWFVDRVDAIRELNSESPTNEIASSFTLHARLQDLAPLLADKKIGRGLEKAKHWQMELEARDRYFQIVTQFPRSDWKEALETLRAEMPETEFGGRRTRELLLALQG